MNYWEDERNLFNYSTIIDKLEELIKAFIAAINIITEFTLTAHMISINHIRVIFIVLVMLIDIQATVHFNSAI